MTERDAPTVHLPMEVYGPIRERAKTMDLSVTTYLVALLSEAIRSGIADRLVLAAVDRKAVNVRRTPRPDVWTQDGAQHLRWGDWSMLREGTAGPHQSPTDGWYLIGPDMDKPEFMGGRRDEAKANAVSYIEQVTAARAEHDRQATDIAGIAERIFAAHFQEPTDG